MSYKNEDLFDKHFLDSAMYETFGQLPLTHYAAENHRLKQEVRTLRLRIKTLEVRLEKLLALAEESSRDFS